MILLLEYSCVAVLEIRVQPACLNHRVFPVLDSHHQGKYDAAIPSLERALEVLRLNLPPGKRYSMMNLEKSLRKAREKVSLALEVTKQSM